MLTLHSVCEERFARGAVSRQEREALVCQARRGAYTWRMRVLLVEDDMMIAKAVVEGLRGDGYAVDWVRDGMEAETALMQDVYDVALLDLGLPRKDGLDVLKRLRRASFGLPVLIR